MTAFVLLWFVSVLGLALWGGWKMYRAEVHEPLSDKERELIASAIQTKPEPLRLIQGGRK